MRFVALVAASGLVAVACAPALSTTPGPADVPRLEESRARDPDDVATLVALGAAYRAAGREADARVALERAIALEPDHPAATVLLGIAYEEGGEPAQARALYERYLEAGRDDGVKRRLRERLDLVRRDEVIMRARALARAEASAAAAAPEPRTVAVFPFLYIGSDPAYRPLERALAEMLVTDLSQTERLTVLERLQVQALLDELQLARTDVVDAATAARSGRLLRAERVVQGSIAIEPGTLELAAAVVGATGQPERTPPATANDIARLLDAEKQLALALYQSLGIELTVAERERVEQRPTTNIQALLAYGEGLEAEDRGDFAAAAAHYGRAAALDPGFAVASERGARTAVMVETQTAGVDAIVEQVTSALGVGADAALAPPPPSLDALTRAASDPMRRDAAVEALGMEGIALRTLLRIVFRRP